MRIKSQVWDDRKIQQQRPTTDQINRELQGRDWTKRPPTRKQLEYLRDLKEDAGVDWDEPETSYEASGQIEHAKALIKKIVL